MRLLHWYPHCSDAKLSNLWRVNFSFHQCVHSRLLTCMHGVTSKQKLRFADGRATDRAMVCTQDPVAKLSSPNLHTLHIRMMLDCSANCVTCNQMSGDVEVQMFQITGEMTRPLLHVVKTVDEALHLRVKESTFKPLQLLGRL